jgi:hypothetical protein
VKRRERINRKEEKEKTRERKSMEKDDGGERYAQYMNIITN